MNPDLERLRSQSPSNYASLDPAFELFYPLPTADAFKTVNGAVFYAISRFDPGVPPVRDAVEGGIVYYLPINEWLMQLFVLHIAENVAHVRLHCCVPLDELHTSGRAYLWQPKGHNKPFMDGAQAIMLGVHEAVVRSLRSVVHYEPHTVPPMPANDDLYGVCVWRDIYAPDKPLKELADEINVSYPHLRNTRTLLGLTRPQKRHVSGEAAPRTPRGKPGRRPAKR